MRCGHGTAEHEEAVREEECDTDVDCEVHGPSDNRPAVDDRVEDRDVGVRATDDGDEVGGFVRGECVSGWAIAV